MQERRKLNPLLLLTTAIAALTLTACAQDAREEPAAAEAAATATDAPGMTEAAADAAASGPDASAVAGARPSVAPGVAFAYRFNFRLPDDAVADAQNAHVAACEDLGTTRCRVTGMDYDQDEGGITANVSFLLDPAIARSFSRDAVAAVRDADGELIESRINGEDVGTRITESQAQGVALGGNLERIEARLRAPGLKPDERTELQRQADQLRGSIDGGVTERRAGEARLAATPVRFDYQGRQGFAGIDRDRPFASALAASTSSFSAAAAALLTVAGLVLPWALMLGGAIWLWRALRRRITPPAAATATDAG